MPRQIIERENLLENRLSALLKPILGKFYNRKAPRIILNDRPPRAWSVTDQICARLGRQAPLSALSHPLEAGQGHAVLEGGGAGQARAVETCQLTIVPHPRWPHPLGCQTPYA